MSIEQAENLLIWYVSLKAVEYQRVNRVEEDNSRLSAPASQGITTNLQLGEENFREKNAMTLQELQRQALQLSVSDRWYLVQTLLESLKRDHPMVKRGNLSRLRGIAKSSVTAGDTAPKGDYATYLTEKYH